MVKKTDAYKPEEISFKPNSYYYYFRIVSSIIF